jgi:hypothetical protein
MHGMYQLIPSLRLAIQEWGRLCLGRDLQACKEWCKKFNGVRQLRQWLRGLGAQPFRLVRNRQPGLRCVLIVGLRASSPWAR